MPEAAPVFGKRAALPGFEPGPALVGRRRTAPPTAAPAPVSEPAPTALAERTVEFPFVYTPDPESLEPAFKLPRLITNLFGPTKAPEPATKLEPEPLPDAKPVFVPKPSFALALRVEAEPTPEPAPAPVASISEDAPFRYTPDPESAPKPFRLPAFVTNVLDRAPSGPIESVQWSYFRACVTSFVTGMLLTSAVAGTYDDGPDMFLSRLFLNFASSVMMCSVAPALSFPVRLLADLAQRAGIKRGWSDVGIGGLCASLMLLPDLTRGEPPSVMSLCFVVGGMFGGFVFWRARGYPGLHGTARHVAEAAHLAMGKVRDTL